MLSYITDIFFLPVIGSAVVGSVSSSVFTVVFSFGCSVSSVGTCSVVEVVGGTVVVFCCVVIVVGTKEKWATIFMLQHSQRTSSVLYFCIELFSPFLPSFLSLLTIGFKATACADVISPDVYTQEAYVSIYPWTKYSRH